MNSGLLLSSLNPALVKKLKAGNYNGNVGPQFYALGNLMPSNDDQADFKSFLVAVICLPTFVLILVVLGAWLLVPGQIEGGSSGEGIGLSGSILAGLVTAATLAAGLWLFSALRDWRLRSALSYNIHPKSVGQAAGSAASQPSVMIANPTGCPVTIRSVVLTGEGEDAESVALELSVAPKHSSKGIAYNQYGYVELPPHTDDVVWVIGSETGEQIDRSNIARLRITVEYQTLFGTSKVHVLRPPDAQSEGSLIEKLEQLIDRFKRPTKPSS